MASKPTTEAITLHEVEEMSTVVVEQLAAVNRHVEAQEAELRQLKVMTKQLLLDNERRKVEVAAAEAALAAEAEGHAANLDILGIEAEAAEEDAEHGASEARERLQQVQFGLEAHAEEVGAAAGLRAELEQLSAQLAAEDRRHAALANRTKTEVVAEKRVVEAEFRREVRATDAGMLARALAGLPGDSRADLLKSQALHAELGLQAQGRADFEARASAQARTNTLYLKVSINRRGKRILLYST